MGRYDAPFPNKRIDHMFSTWASFIERKECASLLSLPRFDRYYRIPQFINWYAKHGQPKTQCISLSFQGLVSEVWPEIKTKLDAYRDAASYTTFLVSDPEWLINNAPHIIPQLQQYVLDPYRSVSFLFFFERNIFDAAYYPLFKPYSLFLQNVWYQQLYEKADVQHYLHHLTNLYGTTIAEPIYEDIWKQCNGYIWLSTEYLRIVCEHKKFSIDLESMQLRLKAMWEGYSVGEQRVLKQIVRGLPIHDDAKTIIEYFQKTGLVSKSMQLTVPLFAQYIVSVVMKETTLSEDTNGHVYIGPVCVDASLSPLERKLIHIFFAHKKEIVKRETIADALWGENSEESYSDWNLDQVVNRLRKRLRASGLMQDSIQTKKGIGYYVGL